MHKASPVELRTSIEMAHSLAQIGVRFVPIPVETDEEFHTLATSLSQKLEMMVAKAEAKLRTGKNVIAAWTQFLINLN